MRGDRSPRGAVGRAAEDDDNYHVVTEGAVTAALATVRLEPNESLAVFVSILARRLDSGGLGEFAYWTIFAMVRRIDGGTPAEAVFVPAGSVLADSSAALAGVTAALAYTAAGDVKVNVTGVAGARLRWTMTKSELKRF